MADNFVRKTVSKGNSLPKIDFYEIGDFVQTRGGGLYYVAYSGNKKIWKELVASGTTNVINATIKDLQTRLSSLETKVADHETRIKALETPTP